jgi:hypothetical protein
VVNRCNEGFRLIGDRIRTCSGGVWGGRQAICLKSDIIISD